MTAPSPIRPGDRSHEGHGHPDHALHDRLMPQVLRIDHHTRTLERAIQMTWVADAKVSPVLALQASLAAVTVTATALGPVLGGDRFGLLGTTLAWALLTIYAAAAVLGTSVGASVYFPGRPPVASGVAQRSLLYFHDIRSRPFDEYRDASIHLDLDAAEDDALHQAFLVAGIAERKVRDVRRAYILSAVTVGAWLPLILLTRA